MFWAYTGQPPASGYADWEALALERNPEIIARTLAIETARCLHEGVLTSTADANIGSIFGIGFPAWTGGAAQFVESEGRARFVANADALAQRFGAGFRLSPELREWLESPPRA